MLVFLNSEMAADLGELGRRALKRVNLYSEFYFSLTAVWKTSLPTQLLKEEKSVRSRNSSDLDGLFVRYEFSHPATLTSIQHM